MNAPINYHDFRKRFLDAVAGKGLQLHSIQYRGLSPAGRPIFTDIAWSNFNPHLPTVLHISGTHGIEGYLGSISQTQILNDLTPEQMTKVNVVFLHALNPWGMSWYRRVNAHNVDLNRNFFDTDERPENKDFSIFAPLAERHPGKPRFKLYWALLKYALRNGRQKTLEIVTKGQYHLPDSVFYGGVKVESEIIDTLKFLKQILLGTKPIYVLDVHTGLGKFASENLILDGHQTESELAFWEKNFAGVINPKTAAGFYEVNGSYSFGLRSTLGADRIFYLCEEFGTLSKNKIFSSLLQENRLYTKLKLDKARAFLMIRHYFPYEKRWRFTTSDMAKATFFKLLGSV